MGLAIVELLHLLFSAIFFAGLGLGTDAYYLGIIRRVRQPVNLPIGREAEVDSGVVDLVVVPVQVVAVLADLVEECQVARSQRRAGNLLLEM